MKKVLIGQFAVDSGQVLICDPCTIDSDWKREDFVDVRRYKHINGTILQYQTDFYRYDMVIPGYGKTMNDMIESGEVKTLPRIPSKELFSYNACCNKTLDHQFGQLGVPGVAVVSEAGYGDGYYSVYAFLDKENRVTKIEIDFS